MSNNGRLAKAVLKELKRVGLGDRSKFFRPARGDSRSVAVKGVGQGNATSFIVADGNWIHAAMRDGTTVGEYPTPVVTSSPTQLVAVCLIFCVAQEASDVAFRAGPEDESFDALETVRAGAVLLDLMRILSGYAEGRLTSSSAVSSAAAELLGVITDVRDQGISRLGLPFGRAEPAS